VRIVFFGTGEFAVPALEVVAGSVVLVVTQPDRPSGRGMKLQESPVKTKAREMNLPVETPDKARDPGFVQRICDLKPDFLFVAAYGQILSQPLLDAAKNGGINLHGSLLPKYRGAAPIQRAILNGEAETGVTLMQMDKGMDTGDIIRTVSTTIEPDETYGQLQERLARLGAGLIREMLPQLESGLYPRMPQNAEAASIAPKVSKEEAELRFEDKVQDAYNRFRAFTPNPGAFFKTRFGRVRLAKVRQAACEAASGTIRLPNLVGFKGGCLELIEVQPEGKKKMSGRDFFNGARLRNGDSLSDGAP